LSRRHRIAARRARLRSHRPGRERPRSPLGRFRSPLSGLISGMPLNGELRALGARLIAQGATASHYRLYALAGTKPPKPGLVRVKRGAGAAIAVEVYSRSETAFGRFVAAVPPALVDRHART